MNEAVAELFEAADAGAFGKTAEERRAAIFAGVADLRQLRNVQGPLNSAGGRIARKQLRTGAREVYPDRMLLNAEWPGLVVDWALTLASNSQATPADAAAAILDQLNYPQEA